MFTRIREVRRARKMTLDDVARACVPPTTPQTIGRLETGTRTAIRGLDAQGGEQVLTWTEKPDVLYACRCQGIPKTVYRLNVMTGERQLWKELSPESSQAFILPSPEGSAYAYSYQSNIADLFLVEGLR